MQFHIIIACSNERNASANLRKFNMYSNIELVEEPTAVFPMIEHINKNGLVVFMSNTKPHLFLPEKYILNVIYDLISYTFWYVNYWVSHDELSRINTGENFVNLYRGVSNRAGLIYNIIFNELHFRLHRKFAPTSCFLLETITFNLKTS